MDIKEIWRILDQLEWSDLDVDQEGLITVNEVGRWCRQQHIDVSNFLLLRLVSEDCVPSHEMDHEKFIIMKKKLKEELRIKARESTDPQEELRKRKAYYLYQWKDYSGSRSADGEIPLSELENVIFCECNPTAELLNAIKSIKSDGSESLNFKEFCDMLENLPKTGIIDEEALMAAFRMEDVDGSGFISRAQLYDLLIENGSEPLKKEEIDEMMDDCGVGDRFKYSGCACLDSLRFLALGDWGGIPIYPYYLPAEKGVGERMGAIAEAYQTSFTLALGDNFYYHGVKDVEDKRFFETFEQVFDAKSLYTPWYVLAGNHDHRGNISAQLAYTNVSKRWIFPYNYYTFTYVIGGGLTVDFTILLCGNTESDFVEGQPQGPASVKAAELQWTWLEQQLSSSTADFLLVAGHFPVYSIGMHGPTDCLVERLDPLLYKYEVTAYLSGHDHNLQHLETTNGDTKVNHFVIGAATLINDCTKHRDAVPAGSSKFHWGGLFTLGGFAYFEATPDNMTVIFIHGNKKRLYETVLFPRKLK